MRPALGAVLLAGVAASGCAEREIWVPVYGLSCEQLEQLDPRIREPEIFRSFYASTCSRAGTARDLVLFPSGEYRCRGGQIETRCYDPEKE